MRALDAGLPLVVFDVDGTLADSHHNIIAAMNDAFQAAGLPLPEPDAVRGVIGLSLDETLAILVPQAEADTLARLGVAYREAFFSRRNRPDFSEPLFAGAREALDRLEAQGVLLALATGKSRRGAVAFLERHGLTQRFVAVRTADDGPGKPDPWMILDAMASVGADPGQTVMVGDTTFDMEMAGRARVAALGVTWGSHAPEALMAAGAQGVARTFAEATAFLSERLGLGPASPPTP
ncbi:HAD-IA family hydrolase [Pararhodospirillum oryzae]|uniref:Haloacid dehalogenase n=1 Tax=Pararhodospirillum oryzae TaxID=478448 RepID=A0A512H596_9PROT|nr:HAD-IA family hydrolase [Pararhodospirillum oryzae]GEO80540.1 haloacid dehalogenase [Pararhodospirillum oryzae]